MGRYYEGDISGKFWFAVQDSDDANFFGVTGVPPEGSLKYNFDRDDLEGVKEGITKCENELGGYKSQLDTFFAEHNGYNDAMLVSALEITRGKVKFLLEWYSRLKLGIQIRDCILEGDRCSFVAEL